MKRKRIPLQILLTLVLSVLCCFALFGCKGEPEAPKVDSLAIVAADGSSYGKAGALHKIDYTVPDGCEISTSVRLGDAHAASSDYSCIDGGYIFYTAGEYTVTVYAAKDGMLGSAQTKLTVSVDDVSVSDVNVFAAAGESLGKIGALHVIAYTASSDSEITVAIEKGGEAATDAIYDGVYHTVVFGSAGKYTIKVTAVRGEERSSAQGEIEIAPAEKPAVTLSLDRSETEEYEPVVLRHAVVYDYGDSPEEESVSVFYRADASESYRAASADEYTLIGDRLTPRIAGEWRLVYRALGKGGVAGEAEAKFTCKPSEIVLSLPSAARRRIQTGTATDLAYHVTGSAENYDVTYSANGKKGVTLEKGEGCSVRVTAENTDYFTVTVVYTHKAKSSVQKTIDIDVYSVESLTYAPVFGEDAFDGMPSEVLTSMGHLFYFNARSSGGAERALLGRDAKYEILNASVTAGASVDVYYASDNADYPYVLVSNFGNNTATGSFTVKMTLTDPATGYSAVAFKDFTVIPTAKGGNPGGAIRDFVKKYSFFGMGQMNFDNAATFSRENMVLTKTGTVMHRRNASDFSTGDFAHMDFSSAASNCRLEFKFRLLGTNSLSGEACLGVGLRTVSTSGWVGFFDLHVVDGRLNIVNGLGNPRTEYVSAAERPLAHAGAALCVRIDRRVNGNLAEYTVYIKTEESGVYEQFYRCSYNVSTEQGNAGAAVKQYQFTHRNAGGCYTVEEVTVTNSGN